MIVVSLLQDRECLVLDLDLLDCILILLAELLVPVALNSD